MVWIPALVEVGLGTLALGPFLIHRLAVGRWQRMPLEYPLQDETSKPQPITVLLPVWNEELIIEQKLANQISLQSMEMVRPNSKHLYQLLEHLFLSITM